MTDSRALGFDSGVQARLRRYLGALISDATDTSVQGVVESLEPAIAALFSSTPEILHGALEQEVNRIGCEYGIGAEVAHLTRRNSASDGGSC